MVNVALPKGRLGEKVYDLFEKAGFDCAEMHDKGRKLIFENPEKGIRYFWVKPSDVPIYVREVLPTWELPEKTFFLNDIRRYMNSLTLSWVSAACVQQR